MLIISVNYAVKYDSYMKQSDVCVYEDSITRTVHLDWSNTCHIRSWIFRLI